MQKLSTAPLLEDEVLLEEELLIAPEVAVDPMDDTEAPEVDVDEADVVDADESEPDELLEGCLGVDPEHAASESSAKAARRRRFWVTR